MGEVRVYLVYQDWETGQSQHVVAENRKQARLKVPFHATHVAWRNWLKPLNGRAVDEYGNDHGSIIDFKIEVDAMETDND